MTCAEKREIFFRGAGCLQFGRGGERWDGEEEGEIGEKRAGRVVIY
jgi:hypothetical protein